MLIQQNHLLLYPLVIAFAIKWDVARVNDSGMLTKAIKIQYIKFLMGMLLVFILTTMYK